MNEAQYVKLRGSRVVADNDCYTREPGTVTRRGQNMFGRTLIYVKLDTGYEACFYPSELSEEK